MYSALFTFEYVAYLAKRIAGNNPGSQFKIGVVAPYRAQADMIDKLLASEHLPKDVDVQVDTIHGFQGDECDIVFVVFNTPPSIVAVSVILEDHIIFIEKNTFKMYQKGLCASDSVELVMRPNIRE